MRRAEVWPSVAEIAEHQWGLVTTAQAGSVGVGPLEMSRLASGGSLERTAHGVYRVRGSAPVPFLDLRAAWLQLAPMRLADQRYSRSDLGVVSHTSAARMQGLGDIVGQQHEFSTALRRRTRRSDVHIWRADVPSSDIVIVDGLPVTNPTRTVVDLLSVGEDGGHVAGVIFDAQRAGAIDVDDLPRQVAPSAHLYGAATGTELVELILANARVTRRE